MQRTSLRPSYIESTLSAEPKGAKNWSLKNSNPDRRRVSWEVLLVLTSLQFNMKNKNIFKVSLAFGLYVCHDWCYCCIGIQNPGVNRVVTGNKHDYVDNPPPPSLIRPSSSNIIILLVTNEPLGKLDLKSFFRRRVWLDAQMHQAAW